MVRLISLVCILMGLVLCSCQTTVNGVSLGDCPLRVEAFTSYPSTFDGFATVSINGMNMGSTSGQGPKEKRWGAFDINLAPGTYQIMVSAEGYEPSKQTVTLIGEEHRPFVRLVLKPKKPTLQK